VVFNLPPSQPRTVAGRDCSAPFLLWGGSSWHYDSGVIPMRMSALQILRGLHRAAVRVARIGSLCHPPYRLGILEMLK
jgi:hypothetical protein